MCLQGPYNSGYRRLLPSWNQRYVVLLTPGLFSSSWNAISYDLEWKQVLSLLVSAPSRLQISQATGRYCMV